MSWVLKRMVLLTLRQFFRVHTTCLGRKIVFNLYTLFYLPKIIVSYDLASESEITPCNKIDKPLVVYRFTGNVMTSITTLRT